MAVVPPEVILPPAETVQLYADIPDWVVYMFPVEFEHTEVGPEIVGTGSGLMVMVYVATVPVHPFAVGVIDIVAVTGADVLLEAVNEGILPVPLAARPIVGLLFVHANVVPATDPLRVVAGTVAS